MEARRSYRLDLLTELTLTHDHSELRGTVINIGLSGVMAKMSAPIKKGDLCWITLQLKPGRAKIKTWARVVWAQEHDSDTYLIGLQFERMESAIYHALADYISERWIREQLSPESFDER